MIISDLSQTGRHSNQGLMQVEVIKKLYQLKDLKGEHLNQLNKKK